MSAELRCRWCEWSTPMWTRRGRQSRPGWRRLYDHVRIAHDRDPNEAMILYGTTERGVELLERQEWGA